MAQSKMELTDWLDDLCVRFIINLPAEDLSSVARICFQVEEAQWYYEDFIRPLDPNLPSMSLRTFCMRIFQHCPLLSGFSATAHMGAFEEFLHYKTRVPVRGAILLNHKMDSVLLVKGWKKGANWSFPRGKINKDEDDLDCAIREVYEETGFNIREAGLVPDDDQLKYIEMEMREQHMRLYVFRNVPMDTHFEPRTRKEISKVQWWKTADLPAFKNKNKSNPEVDAFVAINANKFYMVAPFLKPLKHWVIQQRKKDGRRKPSRQRTIPNAVVDEVFTEEDRKPRSEENSVPCDQDPADEGPSADVMAKTTEALKRLLKIQPATQGIQSQIPSPIDKAKVNKGPDLLALLRGGTSEPLKATNSSRTIPQTPMEHIFDSAPFPKTPHHQPPPPPDLSSLPPPPSFPFQPTSTDNHDHVKREQRKPDTRPSLHPQDYIMDTLGHTQRLRHPQPLPPQVQQNLFMGGLVHSAAVPRSQTQPSTSSHAEQISVAVPHPKFPGIHAPMVPEPSPPSLSEHSLALLNVFKTRDIAADSSAPGPSHNLPLREQLQDPVKPAYFEAAPSGNQFAAPSILPTRAILTEEHKSSLLNIFKGPSAVPPTPTPVRNSNILANRTSETSPPVPHAHPQQHPISNPLNQNSNEITRVEQSPVSRNALVPGFPGPNRRSFTEHKPIQAQSSPTNSPQPKNLRQNGGHYHSASARAAPKNTLPTAQKVFQPQILKRSQQSFVPQLSGLPNMSSVQTANPSSFDAPMTYSIANPSHPNQAAKHQQSLLALFTQKSTIGHTNASLSFSGAPIPTESSQVQPEPSSSRFGGMDDIFSRKSSQTPLSPADEGFLLKYLAGVAKTHGKQGL